MSPQRRTALVSVGAACLLVAIKLAAGLASSSLGLLAEAAHSGTDLAAF
jgi:divalent metal cation (Fe/Co/Zn/Cd) transporter